MQESEMNCKQVNKSFCKHMVEGEHSIAAPVQCRSQGRKRMSVWRDEGKSLMRKHRYTEELESSDQASHGSPARFTWRSRFLEARDQDSLWFVSYVSKRKGRRQVRRGKSVIQKEKDDIRASFFFESNT